MILIDLNQVLISNLLSQLSVDKSTEVNEDLIRHMVLSTILFYKGKFSNEYGKLVLCCDGRNYWRKNNFKYYKALRKKRRDDSNLDWNFIFQTMDLIKKELRDYFPYTILEVNGAEADDIISTMCKYTIDNELIGDGLFPEPQKVLIVSSDKDFLQLQKYNHVYQYSPHSKRFIHTDDPEGYLVEHVLKGDSGDGIPNVLSPDEVLITPGQRQKPLTAKRIEEAKYQIHNGFTDTTLERNWYRNKALIDLDCIPDYIQSEIINEYELGPANKDKRKLRGYFIEKQLKILSGNISEF